MSRDLELRQLRALVAVVDAAGYTRAARVLGLSQSTVSEAVRALERALGAPLLEPGRRPVALTAAGEALLPHARAILAAVDAAVARVEEVSGEPARALSLGATQSVSAYLLPAALAAVHARWPAARVDVAAAVCTEVRAGLAGGRFDAGFVLEPAENGGEGEEAHVVGATRLVLACHPGHPLAGRPARADALVAQTIYLSDAAGSFQGLMRRWLQRAGFGADCLRSTGTVEGVRQVLLADGRALGVLPHFAVAAELAAGHLAEARPEPPLPTVELKALRPRGTAEPPLLAALGAALARGLAAPPAARGG